MAPAHWTVDERGRVTPELSDAAKGQARVQFAAIDDVYRLQDAFVRDWHRHPQARQILAQRLAELDGEWVLTEQGIALERYSDDQLAEVREVFAGLPTAAAAAETFVEGYGAHRDVEPIYRARLAELDDDKKSPATGAGL